MFDQIAVRMLVHCILMLLNVVRKIDKTSNLIYTFEKSSSLMLTLHFN